MMHNNLSELKKRYLAVNFIGLAMIGSVFIYAVVVEILQRFFAPFEGFASFPESTADLLTYLFLFLALVNYFLIRIISRNISARSPQNLPQISIINFALCEAVAVFGLVIFLLTGNSVSFYIFFALSLLFFYLNYPKYENWERIVRSAGGPENLA
jgi:F0F1-type ATP synthase membrane subunit c/vacuolar-type H+-ATPase subunit K